VQVALQEQQSSVAAIFYADALVTLSNYDPGDVHLLAQAYAVNGEHRRAVHLLERTGCLQFTAKTTLTVKNMLLGATCYSKCDM